MDTNKVLSPSLGTARRTQQVLKRQSPGPQTGANNEPVSWEGLGRLPLLRQPRRGGGFFREGTSSATAQLPANLWMIPEAL